MVPSIGMSSLSSIFSVFRLLWSLSLKTLLRGLVTTSVRTFTRVQNFSEESTAFFSWRRDMFAAILCDTNTDMSHNIPCSRFWYGERREDHSRKIQFSCQNSYPYSKARLCFSPLERTAWSGTFSPAIQSAPNHLLVTWACFRSI